jgi:hypothetical protein
MPMGMMLIECAANLCAILYALGIKNVFDTVMLSLSFARVLFLQRITRSKKITRTPVDW